MGSGLILLVIVGAWLAVLVPMALRSHDSSTALSSVDRFSDAMRVLSRREQAGRGSVRSFVLPARPIEPRPPLPIAVRRRRVLLALVGLAAAALVVGLLGSTWGYLLFVLFAGSATAFVVYLRQQELARQERLIRSAGAGQVGSWGVADDRSAVAGIPTRMPARPAALSAALPAPASRYEDPHPVAATWQPATWPVPTYVNAPVAPPRATRVVDLTRPGEWSAGGEGQDAGLEILDTDEELDEILDRRRASGDW